MKRTQIRGDEEPTTPASKRLRTSGGLDARNVDATTESLTGITSFERHTLVQDVVANTVLSTTDSFATTTVTTTVSSSMDATVRPQEQLSLIFQTGIHGLTSTNVDPTTTSSSSLGGAEPLQETPTGIPPLTSGQTTAPPSIDEGTQVDQTESTSTSGTEQDDDALVEGIIEDLLKDDDIATGSSDTSNNSMVAADLPVPDTSLGGTGESITQNANSSAVNGSSDTSNNSMVAADLPAAETKTVVLPHDILFYHIFAQENDWDVLSQLLRTSKKCFWFLLDHVKNIRVKAPSVVRRTPPNLARFDLHLLSLTCFELAPGQTLDFSRIRAHKVRFFKSNGVCGFYFGQQQRTSIISLIKCGLVKNLLWLPKKVTVLEVQETPLERLRQASFDKLVNLETLRMHIPQISSEDFSRILSLPSLKRLEVLGTNIPWCKRHLEAILENNAIQYFTVENFGITCFRYFIDAPRTFEELRFVNPICWEGDTEEEGLAKLETWLAQQTAQVFTLETIPRPDCPEGRSCIATDKQWLTNYRNFCNNGRQ